MSFEASNTESPAHWRTKPRVSIMITALPYAMVAGILSQGIAFEMRESLGAGLGGVVSAYLPVVTYPFIFGIFASLVVGSVASHRAWQRIIASDFNACPCCEYPLRGLPAAARCPECGEPYQAEQVQAHWKECLRAAATKDRVLRLSPGGMQRYVRYSIWMVAIGGLCMGLGLIHTFADSVVLGRWGGLLLMLAGYALLIVQGCLLMPGVVRMWNR